jgi:hypothetical protein
MLQKVEPTPKMGEKRKKKMTVGIAPLAMK